MQHSLSESSGHRRSEGADEKHAGDVDILNMTSEVHIRLQRASFRTRDGTDVLHEIVLDILKSTVNLITGPVGSGKSSLLLAILGELTMVGGARDVGRRPEPIAFCPQTPWLRNVSILENIVCGMEFDECWFNQVMRACALDVDFGSGGPRDNTLVGSSGLSLSGGQKQRIVSSCYNRIRL